MLEPNAKIADTRDYRPGDETAIAALFGTVFGQPLTESQWRWKYTGTGLTLPLARLAFDHTGRLIGHAGAILLPGWRQGQPLPFLQICDVMVHPDARGQLGRRNLFTVLVRELLSGLAERWPNAFGYGFPGRRPFRLGEYARIYGGVEPATALCRPTGHSGWSWLSVRPLAWNDSRLDRLWARRAPGFGLALIRDRAYLHWRYATHPFHVYQFLGLELAGLLLGWAVIQRDDRDLRIVDLLVSRRRLKPALTALNRMATMAGAATVEIWLPARWRESLEGEEKRTEVVVANMVWRLPISTDEVQKTLYYTMGDLDIF